MEAMPLPSWFLSHRHFFVINDHHRESECLRTRLALVPSFPHTVGAARGLSYIVFIELSMQETATRYYLFADFNPRDDFQFSVLFHAVVKIFHIGDVQAGFGFFCGFLLNTCALYPSSEREGLPALAVAP